MGGGAREAAGDADNGWAQGRTETTQQESTGPATSGKVTHQEGTQASARGPCPLVHARGCAGSPGEPSPRVQEILSQGWPPTRTSPAGSQDLLPSLAACALLHATGTTKAGAASPVPMLCTAPGPLLPPATLHNNHIPCQDFSRMQLPRCTTAHTANFEQLCLKSAQNDCEWYLEHKRQHTGKPKKYAGLGFVMFAASASGCSVILAAGGWQQDSLAALQSQRRIAAVKPGQTTCQTRPPRQ